MADESIFIKPIRKTFCDLYLLTKTIKISYYRLALERPNTSDWATFGHGATTAMKILKKITFITLIMSILSLPAVARAEDPMQKTLRDSAYGGLIGALTGTAVLLLTKNPSDHLGFIPTGAAVGVLAGAAYGIASSGAAGAAAEVDNGKIGL